MQSQNTWGNLNTFIFFQGHMILIKIDKTVFFFLKKKKEGLSFNNKDSEVCA